MNQGFFEKRGLLLFFLLLMLVGGVNAQTTDYEAYFGAKNSSTEFTVTAGGKFERPVLSVTEGGKSIRSKFSYRWYIDGKADKDLVDVNGKKSTVDDKTGSSVQYLYGVVTIGNKTGSFKVNVVLTPVDKTKYVSKTVSFTVNVKAPELSYSVTQGAQELTGDRTLTLNTYYKSKPWGAGGDWKSVSMALPKVAVSSTVDGFSSDVTNNFDVSYSFADGNQFTVNSETGTFSSTAGENAASGTMTITVKPKKDSKVDWTKTYGDINQTFTVKVKSEPLTGDKKIATTFSFPERVEEHVRYYRVKENGSWTWKDDDVPIQKPVIKDAYGNDVSYAYNFKLGYYDDNGNFVESGTIPGQSVYYRYSGNPLDDYPKGGSGDGGWHYSASKNTNQLTCWNWNIDYFKFNNASARTTDDYIVAIKATVKDDYKNIYAEPSDMTEELKDPVPGMLYGEERDGCKNQNFYKLHNNEYVYRALKHAPQLDFTPDPSKVEIQMANGFELNPTNRFILEGVFKYPVKFGAPVETDSLLYRKSDFSYCFFVPDENNFNNLSEDEQKRVSATDYQGKTYINVISGYQDNPVPAEQNVYVLNNEGKQTTESKTVKGTRYFSKRGWGNDDLKVIFYGQGYLPMYYNIIPWNNHWDIGTSQLVAMHIVDNEPTHLVISPDTIYTNTNVMSAAPSVKVVDMYGKDVSEHFDITPTKANATESYNLEDTDKNGNKYRVTPWQPGEYTVNVTATRKEGDTSKFNNPSDDSYKVIATGSADGNTGNYEVIYDPKEFANNGLDDKYDETTKSYVRNNSKMGKLHFIKEGDFQPSTISFQEVPGVNITFGTVSENENGDKYTVVAQSTTKGDELVDNTNDVADDADVKRMYLQIDAFSGDNQGNPARGFIQIDAITNGYLTVDAIFKKTGVGEDKIQQYILRDLTATGSDNQLLTSNVDFTGEKQFPLPLIAGHSYALYTDGTMLLHGLSFDPAFIALETDHTPWHSSVTFANGYTGSLPRLRPATAVNTVTYYAKDVKTNETSAKVEDVTDGYHLTIDASTGVVKAKKITGDGTLKMTNASNSEMDDRVTIVASVKGIKHTDGNQVEKRPHYNLFIGNMPIYQVKEGDTYDPGERFSTTNIPTRIWMTIGGWENTNQEEFPYYKNNDIKRQQQNALADAWKVAKMDSVGRDNMTVDNFNFHSTGVQNPTDEVVGGWYNTKTLRLRGGDYISVNNDQGSHTYNVPVRGTYLKFEPQESGRLFVYVLQNGMTDISEADVDAQSNRKDDDYYLRRRATYIVDETGKNVEIRSDDDENEWGGMSSYLSESDDNFKGYNPPHRNYYTGGMLRCSWKFGTGLKFDERKGAEPKYSWRTAYENRGKDDKDRIILTEKGQQDYKADMDAVKKWWTDPGYDKSVDKLNGPLEVIKLSDGGYVVPTKGYVRYTFDVKAGKTYYVFTTGSKTGFCGFGFLPEGYTKDATQWINASNGKLNETKTAFESSVYGTLPEVKSSVYGSEADKNGFKYGGEEVVLKAKLQSNEEGSYKQQKSALTKRSFVNVKLYRTLRNKQWNGICLPFSVSETQVKEIFGQNSSVITFDSVRADRHGVDLEGKEEDHYRTVHFTRHVSQVIEAGRPYFIYPDVDGEAGDPLGAKDGDDYYIEFKHVTFEGKDTMTDIAYNDVVADYNNANPDKKIDIFTYKATGIYDCTRVPYYSYYMKAGEDNGLSRIVPSKTNPVNKNPLLVGYNTYLYPYSNDAEGKSLVTTEDASSTAKMASFWITGSNVSGGDVTAIDELVQYINVEQTSFIGGVYTIDGYKVRSDNSLDGLLPGVYIMGGKKYTVK